MNFAVIPAAVALLLVPGVTLGAPDSSSTIDVSRYTRDDSFKAIKISPTGEFLAATIPLEDRTALVVMRRSDSSVTAQFALGRNRHVEGFQWVNDERLLMSISEKLGSLDEPQGTGEIFAINADGSGSDLLIGQRVQGRGLGTKIQPKKVEMVAAFLVDDLPDDRDDVVISVSPLTADPYTDAERMDVYSGRRVKVASAPVRSARFTTDHSGVVRFASGSTTDNSQKLYYREGDGAKWELINDEAVTGNTQVPVGFSADGTLAYLIAERNAGPSAIVALDTQSREMIEVLRDKNVDPAQILRAQGSNVPVGARFIDGKPRTEFFDPTSPDARLYRSLEAAFDGPVVVTSESQDGRLALVNTSSDRSPGDFYLFDTVDKKADHLLSQWAWFDPEAMASVRPFQLKARDGLALHGYLTVPQGSSGKDLPMVVVPHGGPFGIRDTWGFDGEAQMLAEAGYAVLKLNFRGSGGYGKAFNEAGARQWGGTMQDDLTDATRWAIEQGIADPDRICIYGASYGGYAALMGAAKEPDLYRCAAGYVGVYDLPVMHAEDSRNNARGATWMSEWVGDREALVSVSPNRIADRIKVPVFLAAGGEDEVAPIKHTELMEKSLRAAGVPVEALYYDTEGHGFYVEENQREFYTRLLAFLSRSLGGKTAAAPVQAGVAGR